jgi:hypothetical protein
MRVANKRCLQASRCRGRPTSCNPRAFLPRRDRIELVARGQVRVNHWPRVGLSGEGVKYLLHIIVLFQLVDHCQNLGRLFFRQLARDRAYVLVLG